MAQDLNTRIVVRLEDRTRAGVQSTRKGLDGSSPLARGTRRLVDRLAHLTRFIPARAGNTPAPRGSGTRGAVHPRSRGEHVTVVPESEHRGGSSPLARGTRHGFREGSGFSRFIPARAGNTAGSMGGWRYTSVHPRSRGEHTCIPVASGARCGSSPLARGTPPNDTAIYAIERFIPARAGNTTLYGDVDSSSKVHPRSRGEHPPKMEPAIGATGSSPLARGTPDLRAS